MRKGHSHLAKGMDGNATTILALQELCRSEHFGVMGNHGAHIEGAVVQLLGIWISLFPVGEMGWLFSS